MPQVDHIQVVVLKRRAGAGSNRRKTDRTDGSELRNTLKGTETEKGGSAEQSEGKGGTQSV